MRVHPVIPVFHVSLLQPVVTDAIPERQLAEAPSPVVEDGIEKWDLERIDGSQINDKTGRNASFF
jgi:hypothetical protein